MSANISRENQTRALEAFNDYVISQSRANLTRSDSNVSSELYNSFSSEVHVGPNSIQSSIYMAEHGIYQDLGVKGAVSSNKAPNSPFKFGSGTGQRGGLTSGIKGWVRARRFQFTGKRGRLLSYDETARLITRSIYLTGMRPKLFFSKPFEAAYERLPTEIVEAYGLDLESLLKQVLEIKT